MADDPAEADSAPDHRTPMSPPHILILAAGKGTRMRSGLPKVLHRLAGRLILDRVLETAGRLHPSSLTLVVGYRAEQVQAALMARDDIQFAVQEPQLGTAHAVLQAEGCLDGRRGTLLLLSGDVPLIAADTLSQLLDIHERAGAAASVLTARVERPYGYGRIVRADGRIARIVEERDASPAQRAINEINTGIYALDLEPLFDGLRSLRSENAQGEYYLTDLVSVYRRRQRPVETLLIGDSHEFRGINSRTELAEVSAIVRQTKNEELMAAGVTIEDPATTYIDDNVTIGMDTILHPGVMIEGTTTIGTACEIHGGVRIVDSVLGDGVTVNNHCVLVRSRIASHATVGPFAHLRPDSDVGERAKVGNFVELKKTTLGAGAKVNHLSYLGDATIGERANIGAGTITCNYDGRAKHQTVVEAEAFIGSDTQLVAPVRVGRGAYVAAGSSITEDVPAGALGIARGRQVNKIGWTDRPASDRPDAANDDER